MLSQAVPTKRKSRSVSSFLKKTYQIIQVLPLSIQDQTNSGIVKWADSGVGFVIVQEEEFSKKVLPHYFKHSNYSSFVRQLNMYNFHKVREINFQSHFHHEFFIKDNKYSNSKLRQMLSEIRRKPEKKKRKYQEGSEEEQEQDIDEDKSIVSMKKRIKQKSESVQIGCSQIKIKSYRSPASKKIHENTRHAFASQKQNKQNLGDELMSKNWIFPKSQSLISKQRISIQNILNINDTQEDKLSINNDLGEVIPKYPTHEFFFPSNNNIYPLHVKAINFSNFNFM